MPHTRDHRDVGSRVRSVNLGEEKRRRLKANSREQQPLLFGEEYWLRFSQDTRVFFNER